MISHDPHRIQSLLLLSLSPCLHCSAHQESGTAPPPLGFTLVTAWSPVQLPLRPSPVMLDARIPRTPPRLLFLLLLGTHSSAHAAMPHARRGLGVAQSSLAPTWRRSSPLAQPQPSAQVLEGARTVWFRCGSVSKHLATTTLPLSAPSHPRCTQNRRPNSSVPPAVGSPPPLIFV
jgi:hypothetical protein